MEQTFLLFKTGELYFLLPLETIKAVEAGRGPGVDQNAVCDLACFFGLRKQKAETDYLLAVATETATLRLSVDLVLGVRKIEEAYIKQLDAPVVWEKNSYLDKAAIIEELAPPIAYILELSQLHNKILQQMAQFKKDTTE